MPAYPNKQQKIMNHFKKKIRELYTDAIKQHWTSAKLWKHVDLAIREAPDHGASKATINYLQAYNHGCSDLMVDCFITIITKPDTVYRWKDNRSLYN